MADDDDNQQNGNDEEQDGNDEEQDDDGDRGGIAIRDLLKLGATILVTLIVFGLLVRACASCQGTDPFTGAPIPASQ